MHFDKHYTLEEARALLPKVKHWLETLQGHHDRLEKLEKRIAVLSPEGSDIGGGTVNDWVKTLSDVRAVLTEFESREIQIKDIDRGLVDFPALRDGREIFLCWEKDEADIEHWHDLDSGFAGREPL
jgi:hypothetical protein